MNEKFYTVALKFLSRRPRSEKEIIDNLLKKRASIQDITVIIDLLKKQKFLDDKTFAKWWIEQRMRFRPKGWYVLIQELKQKGIANELLKELEEEIKTGVLGVTSEYEQALVVAQKRMKKLKDAPKGDIYQKIGGLLGRRGFSIDTIKRVIDHILPK